MQPCAPENLRQRLVGARGWLIPTALLALAPKCFLCLLAYVGLGTALGLGGPEICGTTDSTTHYWIACVLLLAVTTAAVRKLSLF
jgi:hypothetical protein